MTFITPDESSTPILLTQPDAAFQLGMRMFQAMAERQFDWWRAWADSLAASGKAPSGGGAGDARPDAG